MAEYIEREEVLELMRSVSRDIEDVPENAFPKDYADGWEDGLETAADKVESLSAADVRPERHGRWSDKMIAVKINDIGSHDDDYRFGFRCSECGVVLNKTKYCGNCGAKMDGKDIR